MLSRVLRRTRGHLSERGTVAVMAAICATMLLTVSAFTVDLGNAFSRKRGVHNQADFAALAGAPDLPAQSTTPMAGDQMIVDAANYLQKNEPQDDRGTPYDYTAAQLATMLTDHVTSNGEAYYGHFNSAGTLVPSLYELTVVTPPRLVDFGLARIIGFQNTTVSARATVGIYSPKAPVFPVYAVSGCDQGPQTITDPASGQTVPVVPTLSHPSEDGWAQLNTPTSNAPNSSPSQVPVNPSTTTITIVGSHLDQVTKVGFFKEGSPAPEPITINLTAANHSGNGSISITLPDASHPELTNAEALWWIRVQGPKANNDATPTWSRVQANNGDVEALPFRVGTPYLRCAGQSNQGNYGALKIPRTDVNNSANGGWLPYNMALGLQPPLSLSIYPGPYSNQYLCDPAQSPPTNYSTTTGSPVLTARTNCVDTDTGLAANSTTAGLVTGPASGIPGRLDANTRAGCDPTGGSSRRTITIANQNYSINNDVLSCFFLNGTTTIGAISQDTYTGPRVISADVYSSPRFFFQPVLGVLPNQGGSEHYKVIDMRPAFIGDQALTGTKAQPQATSDNGVSVDNNGITSLSVIFFNGDAVEIPDSGPVMDYLGGSTPKVLRMTD